MICLLDLQGVGGTTVLQGKLTEDGAVGRRTLVVLVIVKEVEFVTILSLTLVVQNVYQRMEV